MDYECTEKMNGNSQHPQSHWAQLEESMSISDCEPSRRTFLGTMLVLVPTIALSGLASLPALGASPGKAYVRRFFTADEWAFLLAACARLIPMDGNGPGAVELGVPEFIDREMDGTYGHGGDWYMQGPFASAVPELGYQSPLTPREVYRAGIAAVEAHCRAHFGERAFSQLPITNIIMTHLDEEPKWGKLWNLVLGTNYSIGHLSAGQNIPGEFVSATASASVAFVSTSGRGGASDNGSL